MTKCSPLLPFCHSSIYYNPAFLHPPKHLSTIKMFPIWICYTQTTNPAKTQLAPFSTTWPQPIFSPPPPHSLHLSPPPCHSVWIPLSSLHSLPSSSPLLPPWYCGLPVDLAACGLRTCPDSTPLSSTAPSLFPVPSPFLFLAPLLPLLSLKSVTPHCLFILFGTLSSFHLLFYYYCYLARWACPVLRCWLYFETTDGSSDCRALEGGGVVFFFFLNLYDWFWLLWVSVGTERWDYHTKLQHFNRHL